MKISSLGFRVEGLGFKVWGIGSRVSGFGFRVSGLGFQLSGFGFRVETHASSELPPPMTLSVSPARSEVTVEERCSSLGSGVGFRGFGLRFRGSVLEVCVGV